MKFEKGRRLTLAEIYKNGICPPLPYFVFPDGTKYEAIPVPALSVVKKEAKEEPEE